MPEKEKKNPEKEKTDSKPKKQPRGTVEVRLKGAASARITLGEDVYELKAGEPCYVDARHRRALENYRSILKIAD